MQNCWRDMPSSFVLVQFLLKILFNHFSNTFMSADLPRIRMMLNYFSTLTVWEERRIDTHRDNNIMQHNKTQFYILRHYLSTLWR